MKKDLIYGAIVLASLYLFWREQKNGKIHCAFCKWSWNRQDGGNDTYVCHKCGTDNKVRYYALYTGFGLALLGGSYLIFWQQ